MTTSKISAIYLGQILFWLFEKDYVSAIYLECRGSCVAKNRQFLYRWERDIGCTFLLFLFSVFFVVFKFCLYL